MSALDRLSNYSAKRGLEGKETSEVFDCTTPEGAFFNRVHDMGYKMYDKDDEGNVTFTELHDNIATEGNMLINAIAGSGKALVNGTDVYTEHGYMPIEKITVGLKVFSDDGELYEVTGVYPQGMHDVYRVYFSDEHYIDCNGEHIWSVIIDNKGEIVNKTTKELLEGDNNENYYLPSIEPLAFDDYYEQLDLFVPPYVMGVFCAYGVRSAIDTDKVLIQIPELDKIDVQESFDVDCPEKEITINIEDKDNHIYEIEHYMRIYAELEDGKVPVKYILTSIENRVKFLEGVLLDCEDMHYSVVIKVTDRYSSKYICNLAESLGLITSLKEDKDVVGNIYYTVRIYKGFVSWLPEILKVKYKDEIPNRKIMVIKKLDRQAEMTCISIDSPSHLYLTEHLIPTHNTTNISLKIIHDIITGEAVRLQQVPGGATVRVVDKMWVCTFLRSGALELQQSLLGWQRELGYSQTATQINFSTLDAEFKRCLDAMGVKTVIGEQGKLDTLMRKAINSCNVTRGGATLNKEDYQILSSVITYCRGRLDNKKYTHPSMKDYDLTPTILDLIIKQFDTLRKTEGIMDFEEITELLYKYLYVTPNPAVQDFVANRYNYIYIDEFQDTSQIQYAILKFYARGKLWINRDGEEHEDILYTGAETKGKIIGVGDVSQCIYSFKGSDINIIADDFDKDFRPSVCTLSYNWRCPENILKPIVPSIHTNKSSAKQEILTQKKGGDFSVITFKNYNTMAQKLIDDVEKDIGNDMSVAILCRTNFDGVLPALMLESSKKFNFSISGENMTLNSPLPNSLIGMSSFFTNNKEGIERSLKLIFGKYNFSEIQLLMKTLRDNSQYRIWTIPMEDLKYSTPTIAKFIEEINVLYGLNEQHDKVQEVNALAHIYWHLYTKVFSNNTSYAVNARAYIETILYFIDDKKYSSIYEFQEDMEFMRDKLKARVKRSKPQITIATVHEAKGKEWDSVYIWNDSYGVFPSAKCNLDNVDELEEERRVHYIACTRAKRKETIYALEGKMGMFLQEMDFVPTLYNPNISKELKKN